MVQVRAGLTRGAERAACINPRPPAQQWRSNGERVAAEAGQGGTFSASEMFRACVANNERHNPRTSLDPNSGEFGYESAGSAKTTICDSPFVTSPPPVPRAESAAI